MNTKICWEISQSGKCGRGEVNRRGIEAGKLVAEKLEKMTGKWMTGICRCLLSYFPVIHLPVSVWITSTRS
jgi:hypothetical protein